MLEGPSKIFGYENYVVQQSLNAALLSVFLPHSVAILHIYTQAFVSFQACFELLAIFA